MEWLLIIGAFGFILIGGWYGFFMAIVATIVIGIFVIVFAFIAEIRSKNKK